MAILILVFVSYTKKTSGPPKIIWILWFQGWENAPWLSKKVADSWKNMNPGWDVRLIDEKSCPVPIYGDTPQARSDVVRLELMNKYGGVWADSTMLCMQPLDSWVWKEFNNSQGIWMYHGMDKQQPAKCEGPASWFIVAKPGNYMSKKWVEACREYWKNRTTNDNYFWMDGLWYEIYEKDQTFKKEWSKVSVVCCEDKGQAHMLAGKCHENTPEFKEILKTNPPRALKLTNAAGINEDSKDTNAYFALFSSGTIK